MEIAPSKNKPVVLFDIDYTLFNTDIYRDGLTNFELYDEVENMLKELSKKATLGIFSEGELDHQKLKMKKTGLDKYFKNPNIHIFPSKIEYFQGIALNYASSNLYLVDDKLEMLNLAKMAHPALKTIWVKRGKYADIQKPIEGFTPNETIYDLTKLQNIII